MTNNPSTKSYSRGVFYTLISATTLSFVGLFAKLSSPMVPLNSLIFWRFTIGLVLTLPLFMIFFHKAFDRTVKYKNHLIRAVFVLGAQYSFFYYLSHGTLLNATLLLNTGPLFIPFIERIFYHQKIGKSTVVGLIICFIGVICVLQPDKGIISLLSLIGLFSGVCQGASQVLFGRNSEKESPIFSVMILFSLCTFLSFFPYFFDIFSHGVFREGPILPLAIFLILLGLFSLMNQLFRGFAYKEGKPSSLSPFLYFTVVMAGLFDWLFFSVIPNFLTIIGACLIILGAIVKIYMRAKIIRK